MKKIFISLIITFFLLSIQIFAQNSAPVSQSNIIQINNTQIIVPDTLNIGNIQKGDQTYVQFIIINNRKNSVTISNIITPPGCGAQINSTILKPKSKTTLYVGFDTNWMSGVDSNFVYKIILKTNLIKDIIIPIKGKIVNSQK